MSSVGLVSWLDGQRPSELCIDTLQIFFSIFPLRDCLKRFKQMLGDLQIVFAAGSFECGENVICQRPRLLSTVVAMSSFG
jgi:hypothetical protein